jgi:hypothetical protein
MKKIMIALGVLALAAAMCIPVSVLSDDSQAFDITEGSAGVSWESDTLNKEDIAKLFGAGAGESDADDILDELVSDSSDYTISGVEVDNLKVSKSLGTEVTGSSMTVVSCETHSCDIKFKAVCKEGHGNERLLSSTAGADLIRYLGFTNKTQVGAAFEFDVNYGTTRVSIMTYEFVKNAEGNYVVTKLYMKSSENVTSIKGDAKYTYTENAQSVTKDYTVDIDLNVLFEYDTNYEFQGKAEEATAASPVISTMDNVSGKYTYHISYGFDGDDHEVIDGDLSDFIELEFAIGANTGKATVLLEPSMVVPTYKFYEEGNTVTAIFGYAEDPSLRTDEAMKAFLDEHGTTSTGFSEAKSIADSNSDMSSGKKSHTMLYIAVGVGVVAVVAIGAFVFLRARS